MDNMQGIDVQDLDDEERRGREYASMVVVGRRWRDTWAMNSLRGRRYGETRSHSAILRFAVSNTSDVKITVGNKKPWREAIRRNEKS